MEIEIKPSGDTKNFWKFESKPIDRSHIVSVYVSKTQFPAQPQSVKIVVE